MASFAFIDQVWGIVLARIFQGISSSLLWLSASAMTADSASERERATAFGKIAQAGSQGSIAGTFLGFTVLNTHLSLPGQTARLDSWMSLFVIYGAINLVALFLALRCLPETRPASRAGDDIPIRWSRTWWGGPSPRCSPGRTPAGASRCSACAA